LLADDFREFGSSGKVYSKKGLLECLPNDFAAEGVEYSIANFDVQSLTEQKVLATYTLDKIYPDKNQVTSLRSSLWSGAMKMVGRCFFTSEPASNFLRHLLRFILNYCSKIHLP
jgi:hypothetical protein